MIGDAEEMRKAGETLDKIEGSLAAIYAKSTSKTVDEIKEMMVAETWMTGAEAVDMEFATMTTDAVEIAASFDIKQRLKTIPKSLATALENKEKTMDEVKKLQAELADAQSRITDIEGSADGKQKESFDAGAEQGKEGVLGIIKARMDRYKDAAFVMSTIDLDDSQMKDKWIEKVEAREAAAVDALKKLDIDTGDTGVESIAADGDIDANATSDLSVKDRQQKMVDELRKGGMSAQDAWSKAHKEIKEKE